MVESSIVAGLLDVTVTVVLFTLVAPFNVTLTGASRLLPTVTFGVTTLAAVTFAVTLAS